MTANKRLVESYFSSTGTEYARLLSDDVELIEWAPGVPSGGARTLGKEAYVKNRGARGYETHLSRLTEEGDVVVAEGTARGAKPGGGYWRVQFCDVFEIREGKVKRISTYGTDVQDAP